MKQPIIFNATEARQNFFNLLRMVEMGREAVIVKKDSQSRFKITMIKQEKKPDKMKIVERMGKIRYKTAPWEEMEKIIIKRHALCLS